MKMYTVKEIAKLCAVDCETVRRWIRSGQLNATINSKKEGVFVYKNYYVKTET